MRVRSVGLGGIGHVADLVRGIAERSQQIELGAVAPAAARLPLQTRTICAPPLSAQPFLAGNVREVARRTRIGDVDDRGAVEFARCRSAHSRGFGSPARCRRDVRRRRIQRPFCSRTTGWYALRACRSWKPTCARSFASASRRRLRVGRADHERGNRGQQHAHHGRPSAALAGPLQHSATSRAKAADFGCSSFAHSASSSVPADQTRLTPGRPGPLNSVSRSERRTVS